MFCKQCGQQIEEDSRYCRYCGAAQLAEAEPPAETTKPVLTAPAPNPSPGDDKPLKWIVGSILAILIVVFVVAAIGGSKGPERPTEPVANFLEADSMVANVDMAAADLLENVSEPAQPAENWSYSTDEDKVRGATTYYARTTSTNTIRQDSPYDSATTMDIIVRKAPAYGTDVILVISSGQMMCPSYEGCSGTVRFDDGPAQRVSFNGPADNSSETVFVVGAKSFLAKLKNAKRVVIEKTLYQAGSPQFEFAVEGLKWEH